MAINDILAAIRQNNINQLIILLNAITSLDLSLSQIDDNSAKEIAEALKTNKTLNSLNLTYNHIGEYGAKEISAAMAINNTITSLHLGVNHIGDNGIKEIAETLKKNNTITSLTLECNQIGDNGAKAIAEALKTNKTLDSLALYQNQVGDNGAKAIAEALKANNTIIHLDLSRNQINEQKQKEIDNLIKRNLEFLDNCAQALKQKHLELAKKLLRLGVSPNWVLITLTVDKHAQLEPIQHLFQLAQDNSQPIMRNVILDTVTRVKYNKLFKIVSFLQQILYGSSSPQDKKTEEQKNETEIAGNKIFIPTTNIQDQNAQLSLQAIEIEPYKTDEILTIPSEQQEEIITDIISPVTANAIDEATQETLKLAPATTIENDILKTIHQNDINQLINLLNSITKLDLFGKKIGAQGAQRLTLALKDNYKLTSLELYNNQIGVQGAQSLALVLKNNHTFINLYLGSNQIGKEGAQSLALALKDNHALINLYLYDNQIGDEGAQSFALALKDNHTLINLDLTKNQIGDQGAQSLALALENNHTLTGLYLGSNQIENEGAQSLALALENNYTLTSLNFGSQQIEAQKERAIDNLTRRNCDLRNNCIYALKQNNLQQAQPLLLQGVSPNETLNILANDYYARLESIQNLFQLAQNSNLPILRGVILETISHAQNKKHPEIASFLQQILQNNYSAQNEKNEKVEKHEQKMQKESTHLQRALTEQNQQMMQNLMSHQQQTQAYSSPNLKPQ